MAATTIADLETANARMDREMDFWHQHWAEYLATYPEQFVAIRDNSVLMTDVELGRLLDRVEGLGVNVGDLWVRYVSAEPLIL